jgi:hypothetical protein
MGEKANGPSDRLRRRAGGSRLKLWVLLEADRWVVTAGLVGLVFFLLLAVGVIHPSPKTAIRATDTIGTLFQALLTATITGVTLVLTLNQLVLSQELGSVGDQRERMEGAMAFREDVADAIDAPVSPARPAQFLRALIQVAGQRAQAVREGVGDADDDLEVALDDLTESLIDNADRVSSGLDDARFGRFEVISSALNFNYSWKIFAARRIRAEYGGQLDDATSALDNLIEVLELFGPAREHFKTLYFQWDLINLSRAILVASMPALLVSTGMILFFDPGAGIGAYGQDLYLVTVVAAVTVSVLPFLILLAYVLRIATVTKHTLSIGPFILRETDAVAEVEWNR